jgi:hypothetical protein
MRAAALRSIMRRALVFVTSRLVVIAIVAILFVAVVALVSQSAGTTIAAALVALFVSLGLTAMMLRRNRAAIGQSPTAATAAAAVEAAFYTAFIIVAVFAYVWHAPILLSGVVAANLFGLLFWRFRSRYLEAADSMAPDSDDA